MSIADEARGQAERQPRYTECRACGKPGEFYESPTGSWWSHFRHPEDGHNFEPMLWQAPRKAEQYPDCPEHPHNWVDCPGDGQEDHDPSRSVEAAPSDPDRESLVLDMYRVLLAHSGEEITDSRYQRERFERMAVAAVALMEASSRASQPVLPSDPDREAAIASVDYSRDTHIKWRDWLRVNPDDPAAAIAGDLANHERFIAGYDNVLAVLRTSQPVQVEVTDDMVERAAEAAHEATRMKGPGHPRWGSQLPYIKDRYRTQARAALAAALGGGDHAE